jgi:peptidoglycan hydrolase-like protein with peptidoglycan-binding domain
MTPIGRGQAMSGVALPVTAFPSTSPPNSNASTLGGIPGTPHLIPTAEPVTFSPTAVAELQSALAAQGFYAGAITGVADPATRAAIIRFQGRAALPETGLPDFRTLSALGVPVETTGTGTASSLSQGLSASASPAAVMQLQRSLIALGLLAGPPSGFFDTSTRQALTALQTSAGLQPTGILDEATLSLIGRLSLTQPFGAIPLTSP